MTKRSMLLAMLLPALATLVPACGGETGFELDPDEVDVHEIVSPLTGSALPIAAVNASANDGNVPANVLDGSLATRWSCSGVGCWIQADLGTTKSLGEVAVAWYAGNTRVNSYVISVSTDGVTFTQVLAGKSTGTTVQLEPYAFAAASARHVKLTVNGNTANTWASVTELRVYGSSVSAPAPAPAPTPVTGGADFPVAAVTASANDGNVPANVLDGSLATRWSCSGIGCWIQADLGTTRSVGEIAVAWYVGNTRVNDYAVSTSTDGVTYAQVLAGKSSGTNVQLEPYRFAAATARYVKLTVNGNTANTWASVTELRVRGTSASAPAPAPAPTDPAPAPAPAPAPVGSAGVDFFGTKSIYPSATGAREWHVKWSSNPRVLTAGQVDPYDAEFAMRGSGHTLEIKGDGTAKSYGDLIRMYVGDPTKTKKWLNVELTVYGKRVSEAAGAGSAIGFEFQARTDDGHTSSTRLNAAGLPIQCDGKSYGFSFRADGRGLFEKELKHPTITPQAAKNVWNGAAFPKNQWVGMKMIVYSIDGGAHVKQELWRDLTDGAGGGTWVKIHEHVDAGGWAIDATTAATCKIAPDHIITTPQPLIILRNDQIAEQWYKKVSVREIQPQP